MIESNIIKDLQLYDKYETQSLPDAMYRMESNYGIQLSRLNKKYNTNYAHIGEIPADLLENEIDNADALLEMSFVMREHPDVYERYTTAGKYYNENDPSMPLDYVEAGGLPSEALSVLSEPDDYNVGL